MAAADNPGGNTLAPDEAFEVLGNEIRMEILQTLSEAGDPMAFSELRDRVGVSDSGQFNYHLDKLVGHFVEDKDDGYALKQNGRRVIEAVLSGAVTDAPVIERTETDWTCPLCGAPTTEVMYRQEQAGIFCSECGGMTGDPEESDISKPPAEQRRVGYVRLPPAGIDNRTPREIIEAGLIWTNNEAVTAASGVCPRCSAAVEERLIVCDNHEVTDEPCKECNSQYAVKFRTSCPNCGYELETVLGVYLLAAPELRAFLIEHGLNPVAPTSQRFWDAFQYEEVIREMDPFRGDITFSIDDYRLTLTVDDDLNVIETTTHSASETT